MVKGKPFSLDAKKAIRSYGALGLSYGAIKKRLAEAGLQVGRSTIATYLTRPIEDGPGHKKKFTGFRDPRLCPSTRKGARLKRYVLRVLKATQQYTSALEVMAAVGINDIPRDRWRRYLRSLPEVDFQMPRVICNLGPGHKAQRAEEARRLLVLIEQGELDLSRTAFIDEKSCRLDGPAGKRKVYFLKANGRPEVVKRIAGGGQTMLMLCMTAEGFTYSFLSPKETLTAETYTEYIVWALRDGSQALNHVDDVWDDQARPHTAALTKEAISDKGLRRCMRAAKFQDAQMVEKGFAVISNRLYHANRQFRTVAELKDALGELLDEMNANGEAKRLYSRLRAALPGRLRRIADGGGQLLESQWGPEDDLNDIIELDDSDSDD